MQTCFVYTHVACYKENAYNYASITYAQIKKNIKKFNFNVRIRLAPSCFTMYLGGKNVHFIGSYLCSANIHASKYMQILVNSGR